MILTSVFCLHLSGLTVADDCWDREGGGPTFTGNHTYPSGWFPEFQYDPNNPDEIDRNSSVAISVIGGTPPYTWHVSGNGFSLLQGQTTGLSNTLIADSTTCGAATIEVIDNYGVPVTGCVRCTTGQWVLKTAGECILSGTGTEIGSGSGYWDYELIQGNKKQYQKTRQSSVHNYAGPCPAEECGNASECIGNGDHPIPCEDAPTEVLPNRIRCNHTEILWYYEWKCT
jgi:hypothetical protein